MLRVTIPKSEFFDERTSEFIYIEETTIVLEHSLVSLSKWEGKWLKPFNDGKKKTVEEMIDYIRCMTITQNVNPLVYLGINDQIIDQVTEYINAPMTATTFRSLKDDKRKGKKDIITAEIIYYWMFSYGISTECQKWHLNRLLTLIRVFNVKNAPQKKLKGKEAVRHNRKLNEARRKQLGTRG